MVKFLLRRGANLDWQNTSGNTALHYCFAYNNAALGEYLKSRVTLTKFFIRQNNFVDGAVTGRQRFSAERGWYDLL
jgi:ankyrin repeat protein